MLISTIDDGVPEPDLSSEQRQFLSTVVAAWAAAASRRPPPTWPLQRPSRAEFTVEVVRLRVRLATDAPRLTAQEWTYLLALAAEALSRDLLGEAAGSGFVSAWTPEQAAVLLQSVRDVLADCAIGPPNGDTGE